MLPGKYGRGPGSYNPGKKSVKSATFSKTSKSRVPDIYGSTPGPDNYNPDGVKVKNTAASWGMGSGNRPALSQVLETPGPGTYEKPKGK